MGSGRRGRLRPERPIFEQLAMNPMGDMEMPTPLNSEAVPSFRTRTI